MFEWIYSGYLTGVLFFIAEIVLLTYLIPIYKEHKDMEGWRPVFVGLSLMIQGALLYLLFDGYIPLLHSTHLYIYFHLIGFTFLASGFVRMISKLFTISHMDFLTKTYTKRYIERALVEAFERHEEKEQRFSLVFIDLDNFKTVNDEFGHEKGDELLEQVAHVIKQNIRTDDCVGRYGGDEFLLLLNRASQEEAEEIMMRCKKAVSDDVSLQLFGIGISVGTATYPQDAKNIQNLSMIADKRMYRDKEENKRMRMSLVEEMGGK